MTFILYKRPFQQSVHTLKYLKSYCIIRLYLIITAISYVLFRTIIQRQFFKEKLFFAKETNPDHENDKGYYSCNG